jgi:diaminopimelate decarboxylase/aspartate kinase
MKANPHTRIVAALAEAGFGLECVSAAEVRRAREAAGTAVPLLFTPNFCPPEEYAVAFAAGAEVTVDGPHILRQEPDLFAGRAIGLRVDPGAGLGHHEKVRTAGAQAKFGHPLERIDEVLEAAHDAGARLTGLHAHVGSGVRDPGAWGRTATELLAARERLPDLCWLDLGGGLAVVERPGQRPLDLAAMQRALERLRPLWDGLELRLEPGRFLVSEAGVLLATVTQVRRKGNVRFVGSTAGMHTLLRPALYGAWHGIHNLTRIDEPPVAQWHVVGPICESSDVMGRDRLLPDTRPGDVLLFENAGAYGAVMGSDYNMRERAAEFVLDAAGEAAPGPGDR